MHRYVVLGIQKVDLKKMEIIEVEWDRDTKERLQVVRGHNY